jgi:hypothetical protein
MDDDGCRSKDHRRMGAKAAKAGFIEKSNRPFTLENERKSPFVRNHLVGP